MKQIFILTLAIVILASCGSKKEEISFAEILTSKDVSAIEAKRKEINTKQKVLNEQVKQIDEALNELSPDKNVPLITSVTTKIEKFDHFLELQGSVETDQNMVITPQIGGILQRVFVKEGQRVSKGQVLARVDDGGMSQQVAQMQIQAGLAKTTFERQERLWNQKIGSEIQYLQAKSNYEGMQKTVSQMQSQLGKATVRAPFSGVIDEVITEQGSVVAPGQSQLMRIVNLRDMYIQTMVPETYISSIVKNKSVEVFFPVLGKTLNAKVRQTSNFINPANRTFRAEIAVPNKDKTIKPNLTAKLKINDYSNEKAILIPQSIISENANGEQYIYTLKDRKDNKATAIKTIIKTGKKQGDVIEALEGLKEGDEIIIEGARSVKDNQTVKIITY